jgi:hypothetical protein
MNVVGLFGRLLCCLGRHDRRMVRWTEGGMVQRGPASSPERYEYTLSGYRCSRCEPVADIINPLLVTPGPQPPECGG